MAGETFVTVIGRLTADPELRFTPSGAAVANFKIASNARTFDKNTNEWKNQPAKFWVCQAWNQGKNLLAENIAEGLSKGDSVVAHGSIQMREYTTKDGEARLAEELKIEAIGKDLRWHAPQKAPTDSGYANTYAPGGATQPAQGGGWNAPAADPWSTGTTKPDDDEPPF